MAKRWKSKVLCKLIGALEVLLEIPGKAECGFPRWAALNLAKVTGKWALCPGDSCCVLKRGESSLEHFLSHPGTVLSLKANTSPQPLQTKQLVGTCVHRISSLGNLLISEPRGKPQIPPFFPFFCFCEKPFAQRSPTACKNSPSMVCSTRR